MLMIHSIFALSAIFNNCLYIARPPSADKAYITFDEQLSQNQTRWALMDNSQIDGINLFKNILLKNITQKNILTYKIRFYSKGYMQETMWQSNVLKELAIPKERPCSRDLTTLTCLILTLLLLLVILMYLIYVKQDCSILHQ